MRKLGRVQMEHVYREQNQVTNILAKEVIERSNVGTTTIFITPPLFARSIW